MKKDQDKLSKDFLRAEAYHQLVKSKGWDVVKQEWTSEAETIGKYVVYPGYGEKTAENLLKGRLLLERIRKIERIASRYPHLKNQLKELGLAIEE